MQMKLWLLMVLFFLAKFSPAQTTPILPYEIIIDELMVDPSPAVGLPVVEWIEIRNVSARPIDISGCRLAKAASISGPISNYTLQPDSFLVLCSSGSLAPLLAIAPTKSITNFPALSNDEDLVVLLSPEGATIHAIAYNDNWYQNELKKQGGWSLEMIDINNPCTGSENWSSSCNAIGGTPGIVNSIDAMNIDQVSPQLLRAVAIDSLHIELHFNEPLDSLEAANPNHYVINNNIGTALHSNPIGPLFQKVGLSLASPLLRNNIYVVNANGIIDCVANELGTFNHAKVAIHETADSFDVVVNEILFNPKPDGTDYVELYNRSNKPINLKQLYIANLNSMHEIDNIAPLCNNDFILFPGEYVVCTSNIAAIKRNYLCKYPETLLFMSALPSFNDDDGTVVLLNSVGEIIDQVSYSADWHFSLIENTEGIALERLNPNEKSQDKQNWHSASFTTGYGTPGYVNAQHTNEFATAGAVTVFPEVLTPNNDGFEDYVTIEYHFSNPGNVASVVIFNAHGRKIKQLQRNVLCGIKGEFKWHGLDDSNKKPPPGIYIVLTETFNAKGQHHKFKNAVALH